LSREAFLFLDIPAHQLSSETSKSVEMMMKKKQEVQKSNPLVSGMVNTFFEIVKHFMKDFDNMRKIKKIDKYDDQFATIEHMMVRLEEKIRSLRQHVEELKARLLWSNIMIIVLLLIILYELIR
jgi:hypothetical protein